VSHVNYLSNTVQQHKLDPNQYITVKQNVNKTALPCTIAHCTVPTHYVMYQTNNIRLRSEAGSSVVASKHSIC
jgi:hypothetical protein